MFIKKLKDLDQLLKDKLMQIAKVILPMMWDYKFTIIGAILLFNVAVLSYGRFNILHVISALSFVALMTIFAKTKYTQLLYIIFVLFISLDAYFALIFGSILNVGIVASILDTNATEAKGVGLEIMRAGIPILVGVFLISYLSLIELKKATISRKKCLAFFCGYWLVFVPGFVAFKVFKKKDAREEFAVSRMDAIQRETGFRFPLIYNDLSVIWICLSGFNDFADYAKAERDMPAGIKYDEKQPTPQNIYLIVGESAWRDHMSLYGYPQKTTPFLDSLIVNDTINSKHYKGIASATLTREVMKMALSFANPRSINTFNTSKNILDMAKNAGYKTYWISNQDRFGTHETSTSVMSAMSDYSYHAIEHPREDLNLVDYLESLSKKEEKNLFILHQSGSHMPYKYNYDEADALSIVGGDKDVVEYDRTIYHTDRFLRKLYEYANKQSSSYLICYFSDHGAIIGKGHGFISESTANLDIPFVTINNSTVPIDSIMSKYINTMTNTVNNTNVINIISETMGYSTTDKFVNRAVEEGRYVHLPDLRVLPYDGPK